jgi:hypothetical protein
MHFDQLRAVWQQHLEQSPDRADLNLIARLVEQFALDFERKVFRRDIQETAASLAVIVVFGLGAAWFPSPIGKIGCLVIVAGCLLVIVKLWHASRVGKPPTESLPLTEFFSGERAHLIRQIRLLRSVAWWYLGPLLLGLNLISWALSPSRALFVGYLVATFLFGLFVWWLNQRAIRTDLQPMLDEIDRVSRQLASDAQIGDARAGSRDDEARGTS